MGKIDYEKELIDSLENIIKIPFDELAQYIEEYRYGKFFQEQSQMFLDHLKKRRAERESKL